MRVLTGPRLLLVSLAAIVIAAVVAPAAVQADEGMWPFHEFPSAIVKQKYGIDITPAWLDRVQHATIRLSNCTAAFVSPDGLILTNHHCAENCLAEHSSRDNSLLENGFLARSRQEEVRCGTQIADVLMTVEDITAKVAAATQGLDNKAANEKRKQTLTSLEQTCEQENRRHPTKADSHEDDNIGPLKCEAVNLYEGGQYFLYKYQRYDDVRLVFAPEIAIAAFGGDPDNFQFPRWCLDMSVLRAYENGKPAHTPNHLQINFAGPDVGEPVFVAGHPGSTDRLLTVAQLKVMRDIDLPQSLLRGAELRGRYIQFAKTGQFGKTTPEQAERIVAEPLNSLENGIKVRRKLLDALHEDRLLSGKYEEEAALRARAAANPKLTAMIGPGSDPWSDIAQALQTERVLSLAYTFFENGVGFNSRLFRYARMLVRGTAERAKPNTERLREYTDAALPRLEQQLTANVPVYPELEKLTLSFSLERMREWLGPDDTVIRQILNKDSPDTLAARLIDDSKLADPDVRLKLWNGGAVAVDASDDPMLVLARLIDTPARALRKRYEDEVEAPVRAASEKIAQVRFAVLGTSVPPDATFTLRLNFGRVQGWVENGEPIEPFTGLSRLFERATGQDPFRIPQSWLQVKGRLNMDTKFNLSTNNDIVGGNSGSPLINAKGALVGLMFDGNIHSIAGSYWFDPEKNRAVAVHPAIMKEALTKVYRADRLLREMSGN
jgi:hypothetical protein